MCISAIRFLKFEFSDDYLKKNNHSISGNEVLVRSNDKYSFLPVYLTGNVDLVKWGIKVPKSIFPIRFCKIESLNEGKWQWLFPKQVSIPVSFALCKGVWFQVRQGISGIFVENIRGERCVFVLTKPSTHYFEVMTGSKRMPVLINQIL